MNSRSDTRRQILDYLAAQMPRLRASYHVRKIALIGSFARDQQTPSSDVDLLVDLAEDTPNIYQVKERLRAELESQFGRSVEIASERYLKPYYRKQILQEAIYVQSG